MEMTGGPQAAAALASRDIFGLSPTAVHSPSPANPDSSQGQMEHHQMHLAYSSGDGFRPFGPNPPQAYRSITGGATAINNAPNPNFGEEKRKRGRPRRYGPEGGAGAAAPPHPQAEMPPGGSASPTGKKGRGRPRGSLNKKQRMDASGSAGSGFIPHIINVKAGEDICQKVLSLTQNGPRVICILSAYGMVSHVALRQFATSGGTATYEGHFEILTFSGSFVMHEVGGQITRTGGVSVSLADPNGRVFGGSVTGLLIAASPSQIVVGCFEPEPEKESPENNIDPSAFNPKPNMGPSSSQSRGTHSESSGGGHVSPLNPMDFPEGMSGMPWK